MSWLRWYNTVIPLHFLSKFGTLKVSIKRQFSVLHQKCEIQHVYLLRKMIPIIDFNVALLWPLCSFTLWACLRVYTVHVTRHEPSCKKRRVINITDLFTTQRGRDNRQINGNLRGDRGKWRWEKKKNLAFGQVSSSKFPSVYPLLCWPFCHLWTAQVHWPLSLSLLMPPSLRSSFLPRILSCFGEQIGLPMKGKCFKSNTTLWWGPLRILVEEENDEISGFEYCTGAFFPSATSAESPLR